MNFKTILAVDPGTEQSAWMLFDGTPRQWDIVPNAEILSLIGECDCPLVYEMIASQGMAVGAETFETVWWIGRFVQHAEWVNVPHYRVYRRDCKSHLCGNQKAKDGNIRQALIDLYGGDSVAIGGKRCKHCKEGNMGSKRQPLQCTS